MRIGSFIDSNNITDCMVPHQQRHYRKPRYYRWQLNAAHRLWSHSYHFTSMADLAKLATPDTAEGIAAVSGLVWKTWLLNEDGREAGGYLSVREPGRSA